MAMNALRVAAKESKFMKFILGGFIFLAVGGLVFTDINGYFRGGLPNTTVARVGDVEISIAEFDNGLRGFLQQAQITAEDAYSAGLVDAYLQSRIDAVLDAQASDDLNIRISNQTIASEIKKVFANATRDEIESALRARGMSEAQVASMIQDQIRTQMVTRLPQGVSNYMPVNMSSALARVNAEQRSGVVYTFPASKLSDDILISDDEVESYYNDNLEAYAIPEERVFTVGTLSVSDAAKTIVAPTDADVRAEYDARIDDFTDPETRTIEQIVVNDPDLAQQVYELANGDVGLKDAAVKAGADIKTFRAAADYEQNGLPDELSTVAFDDSAKVGDALPPAKTLIGWHVMKIVKINKPLQKPFKDVKADIKTALGDEAKYNALYDKIVQTEDMVDSGANFASIATETGLKTKDTASVTLSEITKLPQSLQDVINQNPSIATEIFALQDDMSSYPIELDDGGYMVVGLKSLTAKQFQPLDSVANDIRTILKNQRIALNGESALDDVVNGLNDQSLSIDDVSKQYGAKKRTYKNVKQGENNANAPLIFTTALHGYGATIDGDNQVQIVVVDKIARDDSKSANLENDIAQKYTNMFNTVQNMYYRMNTDISVNEDLLAMQYGGQ